MRLTGQAKQIRHRTGTVNTQGSCVVRCLIDSCTCAQDGSSQRNQHGGVLTQTVTWVAHVRGQQDRAQAGVHGQLVEVSVLCQAHLLWAVLKATVWTKLVETPCVVVADGCSRVQLVRQRSLLSWVHNSLQQSSELTQHPVSTDATDFLDIVHRLKLQTTTTKFRRLELSLSSGWMLRGKISDVQRSCVTLSKTAHRISFLFPLSSLRIRYVASEMLWGF